MFVLMAMYGQVAISIEVPASPQEPPRVGRTQFGGKRRMTAGQNTSISAVSILQGEGFAKKRLTFYHNLFGEGFAKKRLTFYHNLFAANPFEPDWLRSDAVCHYTVKDPASGKFEDWQAC